MGFGVLVTLGGLYQIEQMRLMAKRATDPTRARLAARTALPARRLL